MNPTKAVARRAPYQTDISDSEWAFVAPYLTLMKPDAPQREYPLREVLNALRYHVRGGTPWRMMPHDFPPWTVVYQQAMRWIQGRVFETIVHDLREFLRVFAKRNHKPTAAILDGRTLRSSPESGGRAGYDGAKKKNGSKVHIAADTLGDLLTLQVSAANEQDREHVGQLSEAIQEATNESVEVAYVDQGYTGQDPAIAAAEHGIQLEVVKFSEAKRGFVLLPKRWVVERSFAERDAECPWLRNAWRSASRVTQPD